ncbi:MAG: HAD-IIB family hydrolase, partial [Bdellovibrionales bacterium]|nr:HAD-IIB family hydrolase [Bdellovibrionales bacterium]
FSRENWEAYVKVNELMADAISSKAEAEDLVWIHDFHFFLLPKMLKQRNPRLRVGFFLHIPFPSSEIFRQLPVRNEVLEGLSASDILGFHEYSYLRHFSISLKSCLGIESSLFRADMGQGRYLRLGVYPISVDTQLLKQKACSEKVKTLEKKLKDPLFLLLGVDRLDYTKGIELKLRGFRRALEIYPELRGKMSLLQIAVPTRTRVPAYKRLKTSVDQLVGNINGEYGRPDYTPVRYMFSSVKESELLALYRTANALLVTSKRDGMNLVCMEYLLAQNPKNPGCVILSEFAGASSLLGDVMTINPWDADAMARSIKECFDMNLDERIRRHRKADTTLSVYSASEWAEGFLRDLNTVTNSRQLEAKLISPRASDWPSKLIKLIAQKGRLFLFLDYDGTLAPICDQPSHAVLSEATSQLLKQLGQIPGIEICIVSGRKKEFLEEQFPKNNFHLAAEHGAYFKAQQSQGWENFVSSHLDSWYPDALRMMKDYSLRVPHSYVETKDASLTWHFRQSPSDFAEYQYQTMAEELQID